MTIQLSLSTMLISISVIMGLIAYYASRQYKIPGTKSFFYICLASAIYAFGYGMELLSADLESMNFWSKFQYFGLAYIPAFWIDLSLTFSNFKVRRRPLYPLFLYSIPTLTLIFRLISDVTHLHYGAIAIANNGFFNILKITPGPWYFVQYLYFTTAGFLGIWIYYRLMRTEYGFAKIQSRLMLIASILPLFSLIANLSGRFYLQLDSGPFFMFADYILFTVAIFKFHFLQIIPLARDKVFNAIQDAVIVIDLKQNLMDFNPAAVLLFPKLGQIGPKSIQKLPHNQNSLMDYIYDQELIYYIQTLSLSLNTKAPPPSHFEFERTHSEPHQYFTVRTSPIHERTFLIGYALILSDDTLKIENRKYLEYAAHHDGLTGVYNRRYTLEKITTIVTQFNTLGCGIIILDLDHFKNVNDTFGHLAGDVVLKETAHIITRLLPSECILGRYGGEEFIVFYPDCDENSLYHLAEALRVRIEHHEFLYNSQIIRTTASFGIHAQSITLPYSSSQFDHMLYLADTALYQAKNKGRNCVQPTPSKPNPTHI